MKYILDENELRIYLNKTVNEFEKWKQNKPLEFELCLYSFFISNLDKLKLSKNKNEALPKSSRD